MKIIFWNTKQKDDISIILDILTQESPDVLFLAEMSDNTILDTKILKSQEYEHIINPGCERIVVIKKITTSLSLGRQSYYYSTLKDNTNKISIISVHLPSTMFHSPDGLKNYMRKFRQEIDMEIGSSVKEDIIIVGDLNVSPFEKSMIDFDGFAASNSIKLKQQVTNLGDKVELYYNPTWALYSRNKFPGTFYYKRPSAYSFDILEHHILDQVLVSYSMSQKINYESLKILEKTNQNTFFDVLANKIRISDHLPIIYEYKI